MTFEEAQKKVEENKHLIGKKFRGATIDDLLIVPTDAKLLGNVQRNYTETLEAQIAILPYINYDVDVLVICGKQHLRTTGTFPFITLSQLLSLSNEIS